MSYEQDSSAKRVGKCFLSGFIALLFGVVVAEVVANSLVEVSITPVFSVVFGAAFLFLGVALIYRSCQTVNEPSKRNFMIFFAILVLLSGAFSVLLQKSWMSHIDTHAKAPMYAVVGLSLAFALSFTFTEFINMGLCDRCCKTNFEDDPIIATKKQVVLIFVATTLLGTVHGLMFGLIDVENDDERHDKFTKNLLMSLPLGAGIGFVVGFLNQWFRSAPDASSMYSTKVPIIHATNDDDYI